MTKPKLSVPADLLKSVTSAKPADGAEAGAKTGVKPKGPDPRGAGAKASTKPAKAAMSHTRTSNRGK